MNVRHFNDEMSDNPYRSPVVDGVASVAICNEHSVQKKLVWGFATSFIVLYISALCAFMPAAAHDSNTYLTLGFELAMTVSFFALMYSYLRRVQSQPRVLPLVHASIYGVIGLSFHLARYNLPLFPLDIYISCIFFEVTCVALAGMAIVCLIVRTKTRKLTQFVPSIN